MAPRETQELLPPSPERRRLKIEEDLSEPPRQLRRGASPGFMRWILEELAGRDDTVKKKIESISTHDLTMGAEWNKELQKKGYGYGPPKRECIRALTMEAESMKEYTGKGTSVYEFIAAASGLTWRNAGRGHPQGGVELSKLSSERLSDALQVQGTTNIGYTTNFTNAQWRVIVEGSEIIVHGNNFVKSGEWYYLPEISWKYPAAQPLRDKLAKDFGDDWQTQCFGSATHFVSHAWVCSFAGLIEAIEGIQAVKDAPGPFVWCDIIAINQHHNAKEERDKDLDSLKEVIKHAGKVHLYFEPLTGAKAIERLWVLYELANNLDSCGELSLGFSKKAEAQLMGIAEDLAKRPVKGFGRGGAGEGGRAKDKVLGRIKSSRAQATLKDDADWIKAFIEQHKGGFEACDKLIGDHLMDVLDATMWALRCKECKKKARLTSALEEALPHLIGRKDAFHLLLKQVEKAKPELLQPALTDAMSHFVSEVQDGLAPSSPKPNRRIAVQHTAAASLRNLERGDVERDLARDGGATRSIPGSMWSKLVSYARRGRWRIHPATPELPDRWMLIWSMLISDPDDAMRGVARQAFADNPQRILNHARWLAEHLQSNTENSWSTAKTEVLRLFATLQALPHLAGFHHHHRRLRLFLLSTTLLYLLLYPIPAPSLPPQPDELQMEGGDFVVASVVSTLIKLESPPAPRNPHKCEKTQSHGKMVESALHILHTASQSQRKSIGATGLLDRHAEELVEVALHTNEDLHAEGRKLLETLNESSRQKAVDKVVKEKVLGAANDTAAASNAEPSIKLLKQLHQGSGKLHMLDHHKEELVKLSATGHSLGADVASALLPSLQNDAAIFDTVVKQLDTLLLQDTNTKYWCPNALLNMLKIMGKLDPVELSKQDRAWQFFQRCLLHPSVQVRLTFDVEMFSKESWTGVLLAPHAALLLEAMGDQMMDPLPAEDMRRGLRQNLTRVLARLSEADLTPHVASLRGLMEREDALKVQKEMIKLPRPILAQCSAGGPLAEPGSWLADVLADSSVH